MKWSDLFCEKAIAKGINCRIVNRVNGWPETTIINGQRCFTKSITYNQQRGLYFQGVDPNKLQDTGDYVLLCGGVGDRLRDIFLIPWKDFFRALQEGTPINTYKPPRQYWQYKFHLKDDNGNWKMFVQPRQAPPLDVTKWRYDVVQAIEYLGVLTYK
jgi:hypothetical protein